jgi:hypothetical protein
MSAAQREPPTNLASLQARKRPDRSVKETRAVNDRRRARVPRRGMSGEFAFVQPDGPLYGLGREPDPWAWPKLGICGTGRHLRQPLRRPRSELPGPLCVVSTSRRLR